MPVTVSIGTILHLISPQARNPGADHVQPAAFRQQLADLTGTHRRSRRSTPNSTPGSTANTAPAAPPTRSSNAACEAGVAEGWLCNREGGGIRYGRIFKPAPDLHGFSVDVVDMQDIAGPHHSHPNGEIDLIMPIEGDALFDGRPAGWLVCPPGSAHRPTVSNGRALVLYLLPEGRIDFTRS